MSRQHIHIDAPDGTDSLWFVRCLNVAQAFQDDYPDRKPGRYHGVAYSWGKPGEPGFRVAYAWWTKGGTVRVSLKDTE